MLDLIDHGAVRELRMARPPVNALGPELVAALDAAVRAAPAAGARMLVLSGNAKVFSGGLDVPGLLALERPALTEFWRSFFGLLDTLASSPLPIVAAIGGHSPAGGAVLALFCDYRVMASGDFRIGLNEVQVGLYVPEPIQFALARLVGAHRAERLVVEGAMIGPEQAHAIGFVDELAAPDRVLAQALAWCERHLALPRLALERTRRIARADLAAAARHPMDLEAMTTGWYGEESQQRLRALFARKS